LCITFFLPVAALSGAQQPGLAQPEVRDWRREAGRVHARFHGRRGTFAHFGDSITESLAFWVPLKNARKHASPKMAKAFQTVDAYMRPECWRDWKGPEFGNQGGRTISWAEENVAAWLERLNPEVALVMFGTNDLRDIDVPTYRNRLRSIVRRCIDHGTVVILSTIPPRHGFAAKAADFSDVARRIARELSLPLVDYHTEILTRRPGDWDGAADKFEMFEDYDVPTLLARDGIHPSTPVMYKDDYSEKAIACHGYGLRNYLVLLKYAEVIETLSAPRPAAAGSASRRSNGSESSSQASPAPGLPGTSCAAACTVGIVTGIIAVLPARLASGRPGGGRHDGRHAPAQGGSGRKDTDRAVRQPR
jgi:hypothetical protein